MDENTFWNMIEQAKADSGGDAERQVDLLIDRLAKQSADDIIEYDMLFKQFSAEAYQWELWGAAHILNHGSYYDDFAYFRAWLVAQGRDVFRKALANPESLADVVTGQTKTLLKRMNEVSNQAYKRVTGDDDVAAYSTVRFPRNPTGVEWDEPDLPQRFPILWAKFGGK
jgi:hypothetical protein